MKSIKIESAVKKRIYVLKGEENMKDLRQSLQLLPSEHFFDKDGFEISIDDEHVLPITEPHYIIREKSEEKNRCGSQLMSLSMMKKKEELKDSNSSIPWDRDSRQGLNEFKSDFLENISKKIEFEIPLEKEEIDFIGEIIVKIQNKAEVAQPEVELMELLSKKLLIDEPILKEAELFKNATKKMEAGVKLNSKEIEAIDGLQKKMAEGIELNQTENQMVLYLCQLKPEQEQKQKYSILHWIERRSDELWRECKKRAACAAISSAVVWSHQNAVTQVARCCKQAVHLSRWVHSYQNANTLGTLVSGAKLSEHIIKFSWKGNLYCALVISALECGYGVIQYFKGNLTGKKLLKLVTSSLSRNAGGATGATVGGAALVLLGGLLAIPTGGWSIIALLFIGTFAGGVVGSYLGAMFNEKIWSYFEDDKRELAEGEQIISARETLGVTPLTEWKEITAIWKREILKCHPDKCRDQSLEERERNIRRFNNVHFAFQVLRYQHEKLMGEGSSQAEVDRAGIQLEF